ncbi:MAG: sigma-70 family RNA polymerase sigma factor [Planctomycetes bacterium]|nr:sigma-70 family RNA polymerase sigma factor [Planctomycetota bacterium]
MSSRPPLTVEIEVDALQNSLAGIRLLVRSLLFDPERVDDVVQEVWVAALENAPRQRESVRAWVRTVAQRVIHRENARARNRRQREALSARSEALPSTAAFVERESVRAQVVQALLSLDEPYRTAIRLRYFEEYSIPRIARVLDVPRETVRTRLKRGLKKLRWRLDDLHDGDRRRWQLALVPLGIGTAPWPFALPFSKAWPKPFAVPVFVMALTVACLVLAYVFGSDHLGLERPVSNSSRPPTAAHDANPEQRASRIAREEARSTAHRPDRVEPSEGAGSFPGDGAVVTGRLVTTERTPLPGTAVILTTQRLYTSELPTRIALDETPRRFITDADGRFTAAFPVAAGHRFRLCTESAETCPAAFDWEGLQPGQHLALGDIVLRRGGRLVGTLVDRKGLPIERGWTMTWTFVEPRALGRRHALIRTYEGKVGEGGRFLLDDLDPGCWRMELAFGGRDPEMRQVRAVREGAVTEVPLRYFGVRLAHEIELTIDVAGWHEKATLMPSPAFVRAIGPDGVEHGAEAVSREFPNHLRFDELPGDAYRILIDDPRFVRFEREDVRPGESLRVTLQGNSAIEWIVADESGRHVSSYDLTVQRGKVEEGMLVLRPGRWFLPLDGGHGNDDSGVRLVENLVGGDYTFFVRAPGYATAVVPVRELGAEERRTIRVTLERGRRVSGRVGAAGDARWDVGLFEPVADHFPRIVRPALAPFPLLELLGEAVQWTRASTDGTFVFEDVTPRSYTLVALRTEGDGIPMRTGCLQRDVIVADDVEDLVLEEPEGTVLEGRLEGAGTPFRGLFVELVPVGSPPASRTFEQVTSQYAEVEGPDWIQNREGALTPILRSRVGPNGTFRIAPIGLGSAELRLTWEREPLSRFVDRPIPDAFVRLDTIAFEGEERIERVYDVRDRLPGTLCVQVHTSEGAAIGYRVVVLPVDSGIPVAIGFTDGEGRTSPLFAEPGPKRLRIEQLDDFFSHPVPGTVEVRPGKERTVSVALPLIARRLPVVDAKTKTRLPDHPFYFLPLGAIHPPRTRARILFGENDGTVALELVPGRYLLRSCDANDAFPDAVEAIDPRDVLTWTEGGPLPDVFEVHLER